MTDVIEFRPRSTRRKKMDLQAGTAAAIKAVLDTKPTQVLVLSASAEGDLTIFTGGARCSEVNWLLDLAKQALLEGELTGDSPTGATL